MGKGLWLVICGTEPGTGVFRIGKGRQIIGRGADCHIHLPHPKVSRRHAELVNENGKLVIRDLASLNGTFVNGKPVECAEITAGSSLRIGDVMLDVADHPCNPGRSAGDSEATPRAAVRDDADACVRATRFGPVRKQVLSLLLDGLSEKQIAARLDMRGRTVHWHTSESYAALDVQTRAELAAHFHNRHAIATACTTVH